MSLGSMLSNEHGLVEELPTVARSGALWLVRLVVSALEGVLLLLLLLAVLVVVVVVVSVL